MFWRLTRKILFSFDPELAHAFGALYLKLRGFLTQGRSRPIRWTARKATEFTGFTLDSPVGVAAGFDKNGTVVLGLKSLGFGYVEVGSVTLRPQHGNPRPRLFRVPEAEALVNRMGFNSQGAAAVAERLTDLRAMAPIHFPIGLNIGKNRDTPLEKAGDDYARCLEILYGVADYLVINLSSPNTPGLTNLQEAAYLQPLLRQVREARDKCSRSLPGQLRPLFLKLSPDLTEGARKTAVETAVGEGFGLIASNTSRRRDFPVLKGIDSHNLTEEGGLSGAPLREDALKHLQEIRALVGPKPTVISVGGLSGKEDARARIDAGANLLQVYTEFVYRGPSYPLKLARELAKP
jgi:dihydroorotate dehydrogenase